MLNPLRSEEEAFRLLLYVIVVVAIVIAAGPDHPRDRVRAARAFGLGPLRRAGRIASGADRAD